MLAAPEDTATAACTVWTSTQVPFAVRSAHRRRRSACPRSAIRVLVPDVGGGFGVKGHVYPEEIVVPAVARRLGRPVKWVETRREHFLTAAGDRDQDHTRRGSGSRATARIVAIETAFTRDHGAFAHARRGHHAEHDQSPARPLSRAELSRASARTSLTHKTFAAAYRGAGRPEAAFVLDRLLDRAARRARHGSRRAAPART